MRTKDQFLKKKVKEPEMDQGPIGSVIGPDSPKIEPTPLGEYQLHMALKKRFGEGYRNVPGAKNVLEHFQKEKRFFNLYRRLKAK